MFTKTMTDTSVPAEIVTNTIFIPDVLLSNVFVHFRTEFDGYARPPKDSAVKKLAREWETNAAGVLLLSLRNNGTYACIDGQTRTLAAQSVGIPALPGYVYIDLDIQDEARLYRRFGEHRAQTPLDRYHAALVEGEPQAVAIDEILSRFDLHVPKTGGPGKNSVNAVEAITFVYTQYGPEALHETLALIKDAWPDTEGVFTYVVLRGISMFWIRYHDNELYKRDKMIERLQKLGLATLSGRAKSIKEYSASSLSSGSPFGQALLFEYNKPLRSNKLPEWQERIHSEASKARRRLASS